MRDLNFCRQQTARNVRESIEELETELKEEEKGNEKLAARRFRELMGAMDVEESTQELALAILKEEGMQAVQVRAFRIFDPKCFLGCCRCGVPAERGIQNYGICLRLVSYVKSRGVPFDRSIDWLIECGVVFYWPVRPWVGGGHKVKQCPWEERCVFYAGRCRKR